MRTKTKAVVNYILLHPKLRGRVTPMMLQKILYFAHGWHLAITGEPLINENVEAWKYGPVVASAYHEFKHFGNNPIDSLTTAYDEDLQEVYNPLLSDPEARKIVDKVIEVYGDNDPITLSAMTHAPNSPWEETWKDETYSQSIDPQLIRDYFVKLGKK